MRKYEKAPVERLIDDDVGDIVGTHDAVDVISAEAAFSSSIPIMRVATACGQTTDTLIPWSP
jgi:hypothetical protein